MTAPARVSRSLSHWVDESLPDLTQSADGAVSLREELTRAGVDASAFGSWLAQQLGVYRGGVHIKANVMQQSEEAAFLRDFSARLSNLSQELTHGAMPYRAHAALLFVAHRDGTNWHDLRDRVLCDLMLMQTLVTYVESNLRAKSAKRGPKQKLGRDKLLAGIIKKLGKLAELDKTTSRVLALKVLAACGIDAPLPTQETPEKAAARAARRARN